MKIFQKLKETVIKLRIRLLCKKYGAIYVKEIPVKFGVRRWEVMRQGGARYFIHREKYYGENYHWSTWSVRYPDELGKDWCRDFFQQCIYAGIMEV